MNSVILLNAFPDKKIKSLGNKCLIPLSKKQNLIDYHLQYINEIYKNPEIIVVTGFDNKKLLKYLNTYSKQNIKCVEHEPIEEWNTGKSIVVGCEKVTGETLLLMGASLIIDPSMLQILNKQNRSFVICNSSQDDGVGCICDENNSVIQCFYGLPNSLYEILFLNSNDTKKFQKLIREYNINRMYLFEIINLCINYGININMINVKKKQIEHIENKKYVK